MTQAQVMAMLGMGGPAGEPLIFTRPFLVVSDINERVFRHVMYRDPQESPRGFVARMDQWRRDIRDKKPHSVATGVKGQVKGYADRDRLQREAQEQHRRTTWSARSRAPTRS